MIERHQIAFLAGMPRAATTFLYHNLNRHPQLFIPYRRKTNYFSLHHQKGEDWFTSHFKDAPPGTVAVDTETMAFVNHDLRSPQLIRNFNPGAKVILCVRDPAAWAVSLYHQIATFDSKITRFEDFLAGNYTLEEDGVKIPVRMRDGDILARIDEYKATFPDSLLLLRFRDVITSPLESLHAIEKFLEIPSFYRPDNIIIKVINARSRPHSRWLNHVLRNEYVIASLRLLLPRKAVLAARWIFDGLIAGQSRGPNSRDNSDTDARMLRLANDHFKSDRAALAEYL